MMAGKAARTSRNLLKANSLCWGKQAIEVVLAGLWLFPIVETGRRQAGAKAARHQARTPGSAWDPRWQRNGASGLLI